MIAAAERILAAGALGAVSGLFGGLFGIGGGVLAIPLVYNGWVQNLPDDWKSKLTCKQKAPMATTGC